jgi:hypothetical protein
MKMYKMYLTTILLCAAIILITIGISTKNFIPTGIGGFLAGVYHAMCNDVFKKLNEK